MRMQLSTRTINIVLTVCVAALTAVCAMSISTPVNFEKERTERETAVKMRLVTIRAAQLTEGGFLADSLQYVPFAGAQRFSLSATVLTTKSGRKVPLMECGAEYKTYLQGLDPGLTDGLTQQAEAEGRYPGLKIGDLTTPNDNDGNWE